MAPESLYGSLELVRDVQLVRVKEQEDSVHVFRKPLQDSDEVIAAIRLLFLPGQNAGSIHDRNACGKRKYPVNGFPFEKRST